DELQDLLQTLAVSEASQQRLFLEGQVRETQLELLRSENELAEYQKKTGILNAGQQASALMSAIATFRARISAKEVELKTAQTFASANNPRIQQLQTEIASLKEEMAKLEEKASTGTNGSFSLSELPDAGLEYLRKLRDQKFYETLYEMLLKQLETARMAEAQEPSIIQVIDEAVPPQVKAKPKRKQVVVLATVLGFFLSIFLAFVFEFVEKAGLDPERKGKLDTLKNHLRLREKKS
nr:GNVR domain-containing protein [Synergistales bacterium]